MIEDYITNIKFCYNNPFSVEEKIESLVGRVCCYNGGGRKGGAMVKVRKSSFKYENPLLPEEVKNKKQAEKFVKQRLAFMEISRARISTIPGIFIPPRYP